MGVLCFSLSYEFTFYKYRYTWGQGCELRARSARFQTCFMFIFITYAYKMRLWIILRQQQQQKTSRKKNRKEWIGWRQSPWRLLRKWLCVLFCARRHPHIDIGNIHVIVSSKYFANVFPENYLPARQNDVFGGRAVDEGRERRCISVCNVCRVETSIPAWMCECAIYGWTTLPSATSR